MMEYASADHLCVDRSTLGLKLGPACPRESLLENAVKKVGFLHALYPNVHISLHAGESGPGVAPKEALRFHIREEYRKNKAYFSKIF